MRTRVYIRADASRSIGYGHFVRSMALVSMLRDYFECTFFSRCPDAFLRKECEGICELVALKEGREGMDEFLGFLKGGEIVVLDNYFYDFSYQEAIKAAGCTLVCVDDMHERSFCADVVISPCLFSPSFYAGLLPDSSALCIGMPLLRQPFFSAPGRRRSHKYDFLISFGGTDQLGLAEIYAGLLPRGSAVAVLGGQADVPGADNYRSLDADGVCSLMMESDAVLCSASSVCFEALVCGCSVYAGWYVDNQKDVYEELCSAGLVHPLGYLPGRSSGVPASVCPEAAGKTYWTGEYLRGILTYYRLMFRALSLRLINYTDLSDTEIIDVWRERNAVEIRKWMVNSGPISLEDHRKFISGLAGRRSVSYFAFYDGESLVGSYDIHVLGEGLAERGLFASVDYIGKGVARMMDTYMESLMKARGIRAVRAEVLDSNVRSLRYHEKMGYVEFSRRGDFALFIKKII